MRVEATALGALPSPLPARPVDLGAAELQPLERALVRRARAGDPDAFRRLFERHARPVRRFLGDLLRDDAAADEGTQETFVRAFRGLATMRDDERMLPWLFGIARNVSHEELRARRRHADAAAQAVDAALGEIRGPVPTPESALIGREADAQLGVALAGLGEERRAALLLRINHGLDYEEIRQVMGWTLAKVKNEIHRARLELRVRLSPYLGGK